MIGTQTFGFTRVLRDKILDDTIPKLTCIIAIPGILFLSYMFLIYWHGLHQFVLRMPFPMIIPFLSVLVITDWVLIDESGILR